MAGHKAKYINGGPNGPVGCIAQSGYFLCQGVYIWDFDYSGMDPFQGLCLCKLQGKTQNNMRMHDPHSGTKVCTGNHSQVESAFILFLGKVCQGDNHLHPLQTSNIVPTWSRATNFDGIYFAGNYIICTACELWDKRACWVSFKGMYHTGARHSSYIIILLWQYCILVVDVTVQSCWVLEIWTKPLFPESLWLNSDKDHTHAILLPK